MKREIRIILSIIMLLVGLIFAVLFTPSAQLPSEKVAEIEKVTIPSYNQPVSYSMETTLPIVKPSTVQISALPTQNSILPASARSSIEKQKQPKASFPESRTAQQDPIPKLPDKFPSVSVLQPKLLQRVHMVIDGDTLQSLASRYLDNEFRWEEIYQVNRPLLEDPTSLPIGAKLMIPPRISPKKHASRTQVLSASTERHASRPTSRWISSPTSSPISHEVARPIKKILKIIPSEPMVPVTE